MGDGLAGGIDSVMRRYVSGPATLKVDWALDGPIPWANAPSAARAPCTSAAARTSSRLTARPRGLPAGRSCCSASSRVADPTRAPEGKHTAWAYTHGPRDGVDWARETDATSSAWRRRSSASLRASATACSPATSSARPTSRRRNANLVGGDVGGGSYRLRQVVFRPLPTASPYRTSLRGLFLGSAAAFPGGAVHGVPGDAAARAALRAG